MDLDVHSEQFIAVCAAIPGIDLELMEQQVVSWNRIGQIKFCQVIKREFGPVRDMLNVEHVMES